MSYLELLLVCSPPRVWASGSNQNLTKKDIFLGTFCRQIRVLELREMSHFLGRVSLLTAGKGLPAINLPGILRLRRMELKQ